VRDFGAADTEQDAQNFGVGDPLRKLWIQAAAAMFDKGEVKAGRVRNRLREVRNIHRLGRIGSHVIVGPRNGRMLADRERGNSVREFIAEVRISGAAAITSPPGGVDRKLHEVGKSANLLGSSSLAAWESAELVEAYGVSSLGGEIRVDEIFVGQFVFGVVMDVLRHVAIELGKRQSIKRTSSGHSIGISRNELAGEGGNFVVLSACKLCVLQPEIAFDDFGGCQEPENGSIARGQRAAAFLGAEQLGSEQAAGRDGSAGYADAFQKRTPTDLTACWGIFLYRVSGEIGGWETTACHNPRSDDQEGIWAPLGIDLSGESRRV